MCYYTWRNNFTFLDLGFLTCTMGMIPVSAASTCHAGAKGRLDPLPTYRTEGDTSSSGDLAQMLLREQREVTQQGSGPPGHSVGRESAHRRLHPGPALTAARVVVPRKAFPVGPLCAPAPRRTDD